MAFTKVLPTRGRTAMNGFASLTKTTLTIPFHTNSQFVMFDIYLDDEQKAFRLQNVAGGSYRFAKRGEGTLSGTGEVIVKNGYEPGMYLVTPTVDEGVSFLEFSFHGKHAPTAKRSKSEPVEANYVDDYICPVCDQACDIGLGGTIITDNGRKASVYCNECDAQVIANARRRSIKVNAAEEADF